MQGQGWRAVVVLGFPALRQVRSRTTLSLHMSTNLIEAVPGMTPNLGRLFSMMRYVRTATLAAVADMNEVGLDHLQDAGSNSIGALLLHIAAVEKLFQSQTIWERALNEAERADWQVALDLGDAGREAIRGHDLAFYMDRLESVRTITESEFAKRDDEWLQSTITDNSGRAHQPHYKWFHMFEDELNHRGQIRWLRKRVPE
jgi:uncharacterized damage-inducible protein DinB